MGDFDPARRRRAARPRQCPAGVEVDARAKGATMDSTLRIAVLSDIHGNLPALRAVLDDVARRGADLVVNCGDLLSGPLWPAATAALLRAHDWPTVAGNHERQLLACAEAAGDAADALAWGAIDADTRDWLRALPAALRPLPDVLMVHGRPDSDLDYLLETVDANGARAASAAELDARLRGNGDAGLLLCGHSHRPRCVQHGGLCILTSSPA
jgi:predicted phosphodiesterase